MFVKVNDTWLEYTEISHEDKPFGKWNDYKLVSVADEGEILYKNHSSPYSKEVNFKNTIFEGKSFYKIKNYLPLVEDEQKL
jgi:hypothetical protein